MIAQAVPRLDAPDWIDVNQLVLAAELGRIASLLRAAGSAATVEVAEAEDQIERARLGLSEPAAIDWLAEAFGLSGFERDVLLLAAGADLDASLAELSAAASGRDRPTFGLALACLPGAHWSALLPDAPLRRWRLVEIGPAESPVSAPLRVPESVLHALTGLEALDPELAAILEPATPSLIATQRQLAQIDELAAHLATEPEALYELTGDDRDGQIDLAARSARRLGLRVWVLGAADIPADPRDRQALAIRWSRDAVLLRGALIVRVADAADAASSDFLRRLRGTVFVSAPVPVASSHVAARLRVDRPGPVEQRELWLLALDEHEIGPDLVDTLAGQLRLSAREVIEAAPRVRRALQGGAAKDVFAAAQPATMAALVGGLATRIEARATWDDLVLPADQVAALRELVAQVRGRTRVNEVWGFRATARDGGGIAALFEGESGTGKSLAAEVVASELGLPLLRVDLASVVSKYIGETEKNIARIFEVAEGSGAIILFDEAEALFGKRSEVRDSHDRYANIEIAYLLARMEAYRGLAILTSNAKSSLDRAFQRRLRFVIRFPFPDVHERELIWRTAFPHDAPVRGIAYDKLAQLALAGGDIRNIATGAAFQAAAAGQPISMRHLRAAARRELDKLGRAPTEADTRGWQ